MLNNKIVKSEFTKLREKFGKELVDGVAWRNVKTEFKRKHLPLVINPKNGEIID